MNMDQQQGGNEIPMLLPTNMNANANFGGGYDFAMNNQGQYQQQPSLLNELNSNDDYQQQGDGNQMNMDMDDDQQSMGGGSQANNDDQGDQQGDDQGEDNNSSNNRNNRNSNNRNSNNRRNNNRRSNNRRSNGNNNNNNSGGGNSHATHTGNRGQPAVFISAEGSPRTYAAKIAEHVREGQPPVLMAAGANSINQATKSLAYAREYLASDGLDLSAQPEYRQREDGGLTRSTTALSFQCIILQLPKVTSIMDVELKVSKRSDPNTIAGAIAGKCREHLRVGIQSIGPVCTVRAVSAIAIARRYLVNDGQDLRFRPEFISCEFEEGSSCMGLRLTILQMQV